MSESIETRLPEVAIACDPGIQFTQGLRAKRIDSFLALRSYLHQARLLQNAKMTRNSRLVDLHLVDQIVHRPLSGSKRLHDAKTHRIAKCMKNHRMHIYVYTYICIYMSSFYE